MVILTTENALNLLKWIKSEITLQIFFEDVTKLDLIEQYYRYFEGYTPFYLETLISQNKDVFNCDSQKKAVYNKFKETFGVKANVDDALAKAFQEIENSFIETY